MPQKDERLNEELPMVSIIVPVYNVREHIARCLDSVLGQSYPLLEVIVVDDGSTDGSGQICDQYAQLDSRVKTYHIDNRGLSGARNYGLCHVSGEYISFVDSDDFIGLAHIENLLVAAIASNSEIAITGSQHVPCTTSIPEDPTYPTNYNVMSPIEAINHSLTPGSSKRFNITAWGKLYKSSLRSELKFPEGRNFEDMFIMHRVFDSSKRLIYENANDYYYCFDREGSISKRHDESYLDIIEANRRPFEYALEFLPEILDASAKRYYSSIIAVYAELALENNELRNEVFRLIAKERRNVLFTRHSYLSTKIAYWFSFFGKNALDKAAKLHSAFNPHDDTKKED